MTIEDDFSIPAEKEIAEFLRELESEPLEIPEVEVDAPEIPELVSETEMKRLVADLERMAEELCPGFSLDDFAKSGFAFGCGLCPGKPEEAAAMIKKLQEKAKTDAVAAFALKELSRSHRAFVRTIKGLWKSGWRPRKN